MTLVLRTLFRIALFWCVTASAWSQDLSGQWDLQVQDLTRNPKARMVLRFTDAPALGCNGSGMKKVIVLSATDDLAFFPTSLPLAYKIEDGQLFLGYVEKCDAFRWLKGSLKDHTVAGEYFFSGFGGRRALGYFTLTKRD